MKAADTITDKNLSHRETKDYLLLSHWYNQNMPMRESLILPHWCIQQTLAYTRTSVVQCRRKFGHSLFFFSKPRRLPILEGSYLPTREAAAILPMPAPFLQRNRIHDPSRFMTLLFSFAEAPHCGAVGRRSRAFGKPKVVAVGLSLVSSRLRSPSHKTCPFNRRPKCAGPA